MKIIKIISNCLISVIIIVLLILLFISFSSRNDGLSNIGNYSLLDVNGSSMKPKLRNGDLIAVNRKIKDQYEVGDIISFAKETDEGVMIITHKVIDVKDDGYVTKGINNPNQDDSIVMHSEIIGEYKGFRIPLIGYMVRVSRTQVGYLLLVVMPLGLIFMFSVYELLKEISKKKGEA